MPIAAWARKLAPPGDEPQARIRWQGPTSYTQVTPGLVSASGGDAFPSALLGVQDIQAIEFVGTDTGNFEVVAVRQASNQWYLMWRALNSNTVGTKTQTTGTEAVAGTNLSAEYVYLVVTTRSA